MLKKAIDEFKQELLDEADEYWKHIDKVGSTAIEKNVADGWGLVYSMTPLEYCKPMDYGKTEKDLYFIELFESDRLLEVEFEQIIDCMGEGLKNSLEETLLLIRENKIRTIIPFLITVIEKCLRKTMGNDPSLWGTTLVKKYKGLLNTVPKEEFAILNVLQMIKILEDYVFKNKVNHYTEVPLFNRNLILHGNDIPDRWTKTEVYKIISLIGGLVYVDLLISK